MVPPAKLVNVTGPCGDERLILPPLPLGAPTVSRAEVSIVMPPVPVFDTLIVPPSPLDPVALACSTPWIPLTGTAALVTTNGLPAVDVLVKVIAPPLTSTSTAGNPFVVTN